ncbi:hypothetical protein [Pseudomonas syringae]|uniref:hypothetical protein n=1 Tax=Pseudomonas syringae TaxID=317 RepID=UPI0011AEED33|nr:hypothetical protein [Pseudomonas syringae]
MKLQKLENFCMSDEKDFSCDLLIIYSCSESRSTNILDKYSFNRSKVFVIEELVGSDDDLSHSSSLGRFVLNRQTYQEQVRGILENLDKPYKIALDISCLPHAIMAEILYMISAAESEYKVEVIVLYSLAKFTFPSASLLANESIEPVHKNFAGWSSPETKPTSLILGLGYEPNKAEGASEYFEPSDQWIFIPKSPIREFLDQVYCNNENLIKKTDDDRIIEYNVADPELTYGQIELVISSLARKSNPVLLPFGPKIFFFLCLVQCLTHPELGVWRVTGVEDQISRDVHASEYVIGVRCVFS